MTQVPARSLWASKEAHLNSFGTTWKAGQNLPGKKENVQHLCSTLIWSWWSPWAGFWWWPSLWYTIAIWWFCFLRSCKWPKCNSSINMIDNQDNYVNYWVQCVDECTTWLTMFYWLAFGNSYGINDRYCINNLWELQFSVQYITSWCTWYCCYNGCRLATNCWGQQWSDNGKQIMMIAHYIFLLYLCKILKGKDNCKIESI